MKTCQYCLTPCCSAVTSLNVKLSVHTANSVLFISPHTWCQITIHHSWRQLFSTHAVSDKAKEMKSCWFFPPFFFLHFLTMTSLNGKVKWLERRHSFEPSLNLSKGHRQEQGPSQWEATFFFFFFLARMYNCSSLWLLEDFIACGWGEMDTMFSETKRWKNKNSLYKVEAFIPSTFISKYCQQNSKEFSFSNQRHLP